MRNPKQIKFAQIVHGKSDSKTYKTWSGMKARCNNPNSSHYEYYGGRGIKVCPEWDGPNNFEKFLEDMGERPDHMELDRIDPNGDYTKENCRWVSRLENINNTRRNKYITYLDKTLTISQWAREIKADPSALYHRLFIQSWPVEKALTQEFKPFKKTNYTLNDETKTLSEWCRVYNIDRSCVKARLERGWTLEQSLTISTDGYFRKVR